MIDDERHKIEDDEQAKILGEWRKRRNSRDCCASLAFLILNGIFWAKITMEMFA